MTHARRAQALQQCLSVADRLLNPDEVTTGLPTGAAGTLADGLPGTALLHARLACMEPDFATAAVAHWVQAARRTPKGAGFLGVFHAGAGLATSLIIGVPYLPDPSAHATGTARAAQWLCAQAVDLAARHRATPGRSTTGTPWQVYDAITGLAGTGRVLLSAFESGHTIVEPGLIAALNTLTGIIQHDIDGRPGWWLSADRHPNLVVVPPSGAATTGMAHGIAGPLAFLATAHLAGITVPGQLDAVTHAGTWLVRQRDERTGTWPPYVTGENLDTVHADAPVGRADAWCYGTPGISRALDLAGQATSDPCLSETAREALHQLAQRAGSWDSEGPTLCHGHSGVLRVAEVMHDTDLAAHAATAITGRFAADSRFGFRHVAGHTAEDRPGFLTGATGTALALAEHAGLPVSGGLPTCWDALLLVS